MEIASSWKLQSAKDSKFNISELSSKLCLLSPDGKIFCQCKSNNLEFITNDKIYSSQPLANLPEKIACISTIFSAPWILSIGTSEGRVFFYNCSTNKYIFISPDNQPVLFLKMCLFTESYFTTPYSVLLIQYPRGICATINRDYLLKNIQNNTDKIDFDLWQLRSNSIIRDSVIVNSDTHFPIFSDLHRFPAVYSVGKPFITVSHIKPDQKQTTFDFITKKAFDFLKSFIQESNSDVKEEKKIIETFEEWKINDDKREGTSITADPTGRWLAICDNMFRVIIVDSVFGHITKVLKGYRDAQVAWFSPSGKVSNNAFLVVYVPTREIIVACTIPNGHMVAAVKVARDGKLFQIIDDNSNYGVAFLYPSGDVAIIKVTAIVSDDKEENGNDSEYQKDSFEDCHFTVPAVLASEKDPIIQELQKLLLQKKWRYEEVKKLATKVTDKFIGGYFIKILSNSAAPRSSNDNDDDFMLEIINIISLKLNITDFEGSSREFFDSCYSSIANGENDIIIYKVLSTKWSEYSTFQKITVPNDEYPQTNLTDKYKSKISNVIDSFYPKSNDIKNDQVKPSLRSFLAKPMTYPLFFFSFMRSTDVTADSIFDSFRFSREDRHEFVLQFLAWIIKCQPAQILLTQEAINDFLGSKEIKNIAAKQIKLLEIPKNTFKEAALSDFMSF